MTRSSLVRLSLLCLVTLLTLGGVPAALAQRAPTQVEAVMLSGRIPVGERTAYVVRIVNGRPETLPDRIEVDGLDIVRSEGHNHKQTSINGVFQSEYQFYYQVTANKPGEYEIPAITARVDGQDYTTQPVALTVYERDPNDPALDASRPYFANLTTPNRVFYQGQMVPIDLDVYVRGKGTINDMGPPLLRHESLVIEFDRNFQLDITELDGIQFTTGKRSGSLFGLTPGTYDLGPAEAMVAMMDDTSPFGRMPGFFGSFVTKTLRSNPMKIEVRPLPTEGKPLGFAGAVGNFEVKVAASPRQLTVGDPISLEFEVTGPGNYETLQAPAFLAADAASWRSYDARKIVDPAQVSDGVQPGRATFSQIVMPQAEVSEIPPFELIFFNPATGSYESQRTEPIPITVSPDTRIATAAPAGLAIPGDNAGAQAAGPSAFEVEGAPTPKPAFNDIVHLPTVNPDWRPTPATVTSRPAFWVGQIVPSIALFTLLGLGIARKARGRLRRGRESKSTSFKSARSAVESATSRTAYYRAVLVALDSWRREAGSEGERSLPESLSAAFHALKSRAQWLVYGTHTGEQNRPIDASEKGECARILDALGARLD